MSIDHDQEHVYPSFNKARVIDVEARPGTLGKFPGLDGGSWRKVLVFLALLTLVNCSLEFLVYARPPDEGSSESLHAGDSRVTLMQFTENFPPSLGRNDAATAPENATIIQTELVSALVERFESLIGAVLPARCKHGADFGEDWVTGGP